jgi:hypothetical protein
MLLMSTMGSSAPGERRDGRKEAPALTYKKFLDLSNPPFTSEAPASDRCMCRRLSTNTIMIIRL